MFFTVPLGPIPIPLPYERTSDLQSHEHGELACPYFGVVTGKCVRACLQTDGPIPTCACSVSFSGYDRGSGDSGQEFMREESRPLPRSVSGGTTGPSSSNLCHSWSRYSLEKRRITVRFSSMHERKRR